MVVKDSKKPSCLGGLRRCGQMPASGPAPGCVQVNTWLRAVSVMAETAGCLMRRSAEMA